MTAVVPEYVPGLELDRAGREEALRLVERVRALVAGRTTDQAGGTWEEPVANYLDPALFEAEKELLFRRVPLPLALSCELPGPNTYKAVDAAGTPVVITRDGDGAVHAMLNVCRHRGAEVCPAGTGRGRTLTCPYHAWSYRMDGSLAGVYGASTFGDFDKSARGLVPLPVEERHGLVFVVLTPGAPLDLDAWLGDVGTVLASLRLAETHHFSTRMMPGPNWKVAVEGYLEGYHFASLHTNTVFRTNLGNTAAWDSFGWHQRLAFALRPIADLGDTPQERWDPATLVGPIVWLFPGFAIAGGWRDRIAVAFPLPGATPTESMTEQRILTRTPPSDDRAREEAELARDWFYDVTYGEDYLTGYGVQRGIPAMAERTMLVGRNEPGVQHLHRAINAVMAEHHRPPHPLPRTA
ncbi:aromatic ring-hydroxylating dioxygenase subunit alpha [Blastococcus sp. SYSU D00669]